MHGHSRAVGGRGHRLDLLGLAAGAPVAVVRVLHADEAGDGDVDVARADVLPHLFRREESPLGAQGQGLQAAEHRRARHLVIEDVRVRVQDDLLAVPRVAQHRDEVALGPGGDEQRRVLARALRRHLLQAGDGGVLLPHVVAHLGARHGLSHGRGGKRQRVRAQVGDVVHGPTSWRPSGAARRRVGPIRCRSTRRRAGGRRPGPPGCAHPERIPPRAGTEPRGSRASAGSP